MEDEEAELAEIQRLDALDAQRAAATKAALAAEQAAVREQNDMRLAAKQEAEAHAKAEDRELMAETLRTLDKQEADRRARLAEFHVRTLIAST